MIQTSIFWYFIGMCLFILTFSSVSDFKRFFLLSESVWLSMFVLILSYNIIFNNPLMLASSFFVLIFTAIEAVLVASVLLILENEGSQNSFKRGDSV